VLRCGDTAAYGTNRSQTRAVRANARASGKAGVVQPSIGVALIANCAPADPPTACKIAANDPAGAEVCAGLELTPGTDDKHERFVPPVARHLA
jgi:hypothetical protein